MKTTENATTLNAATKMNIAIQGLDWNIEAAQKEVQEYLDSIKSYIDNTYLDRIHYDAEMIEDEAKRLAKAAQKLRMLTEQKQVMEHLAESFAAEEAE